MARPRRATLTAHIQPSSLSLSESAWVRLGQIAGAALEKNARDEISSAAEQYIQNTLLQKDGADRAQEIRKRTSLIGKWRASAAKTVRAWDALSFEQQFTLLQFSPAMASLKLYLDEWGAEIRPIEVNPTEVFIYRVAAAIETAGGRVSASGDVSDRKRLSRFQRVIAVLNRRLPSGVQKSHSRDALAAEVNKALIRWRDAR